MDYMLSNTENFFGYIPKLFTRRTRPQTVTHPCINRARRTVTTLIETNALPLSQAATCLSVCLSL